MVMRIRNDLTTEERDREEGRMSPHIGERERETTRAMVNNRITSQPN